MKKLINFFRRLNYNRQVRRMNRKMNRVMNFRHFRKACHEAIQLSKENNRKRYRVFLFDEYRALSKEDITRMKNRRLISKNQETGLLSKEVLFDTYTMTNLHPTFSNRKI